MSTASTTSSRGQNEFSQSCDLADNYPFNLPRFNPRETTRQTFTATWNREANKTFDDRRGSLIRFSDTCNSCNCPEGTANTSSSVASTSSNQDSQSCDCRPQLAVIKSLQSLTDHLRSAGDVADPKIRYISILSPSSRDALKCSSSMFKYLCTYHQIPPSVLNCVYSFRSVESSYDYGLALFKDDNTLLSRPEHTLALDHLGRSGREIRYSFLLRSVEASTSIPGRSWGIRQLSVYHSFDVRSGRSFWMTFKGNDAIEKSINDALSKDPVFKPDAVKSVPDAFSATFEILAIILDWCDENWRWYINSMVDEVMKKADITKTYKIADEQDFGKLKKRLTHMDQSDRLKRPRSSSVDLERGRLEKIIRAVSFNRKKSVDQSLSHIEGAVDELERLKLFSFKELQDLQEVLERVQEALLVLKLNHQVIIQIRNHYEALMNEYKIRDMKDIQNHCTSSFLRLCHHCKSVEGSIETREAQLSSLHVLIQENKSLYESILHYKDFQTNKIYADSAQISAYNMEVIANKTKQETTSMHVITFVTLIFLPATFMASFFQSGILQWPDFDLKPGDGHKLNLGIFGLFMGISVAITLFTIFVWFLVSRNGRGKFGVGS